MTEMVSIPNDELTTLKERLKNLAVGNAQLKLTNHLMKRISAVQGLENTIATIMQSVLDSIGGTNHAIYYFIDNNIYFTDVFGKKMKLDIIDDILVQKVMDNNPLIDYENEHQHIQIDSSELDKGITWVFPLNTGTETIAIYRIDGMKIQVSEFQAYLSNFFNYATLVLRNEIQGYTRLKNANEELSNINEALRLEIIERKAIEEALQEKTQDIRRIAYSDVLTSLPNRMHLNDWLNIEMEKTRRGKSAGAVLFIDLDNLKMVNDTFGHTAGDRLIKLASAYIVAEVGKSAFVARLGGDEFVVILAGKRDRKSIACIADKVIRALNKEYEVQEGVHFHMAASMGVAIYPDDGDTTEDILKNADNAMYVAKGVGKQCWRFYESSMQKDAYDKIVLTNSLRYAAERGELLLHYQPQVDVETGTVIGFEALLRWNSPKYGWVSPVRFIPLAEHSGLIHKIGQWVLEEACGFIKRLSGMGLNNIYIAVNISSHQLAADDFIAIVRKVVSKHNINPRQLELEITESVLMVSLEGATKKLNELRAMGIRLSLDDFGTGYSSLTYLRFLPVGTLKIDKAFIDMILIDPVHADIIGSIIDMAHILKMSVIAEGVETEQQLACLSGKCCDSIQGYLASKPIAELEAIDFLNNQPLRLNR